MIRNMEKAHMSISALEKNMMVNGLKARSMGMVYTTILMGTGIVVNGKMEKKMVEAILNMLKGQSLKGNSKMIKQMGMESCNILMEIDMMGVG